jgi:hypothetical protein
MNSAEVTKDPNAIENIVCKSMDKLKHYPMNEDQTKLLMTLHMCQQGTLDIPKEFFVSQIMMARSKSFTFEFEDNKIPIFFASICQGPGEAMLYLHYLQYKCKELGVKVLDINVLCEKIFPMGFFKNEELMEIWDAQKVERSDMGSSDNLVDYMEAARSIL